MANLPKGRDAKPRVYPLETGHDSRAAEPGFIISKGENVELIKSGGGNVKEIVVLNDTGRKILTNGKSYFKLERGLKKCKN